MNQRTNARTHATRHDKVMDHVNNLSCKRRHSDDASGSSGVMRLGKRGRTGGDTQGQTRKAEHGPNTSSGHTSQRWASRLGYGDLNTSERWHQPSRRSSWSRKKPRQQSQHCTRIGLDPCRRSRQRSRIGWSPRQSCQMRSRGGQGSAEGRGRRLERCQQGFDALVTRDSALPFLTPCGATGARNTLSWCDRLRLLALVL